MKKKNKKAKPKTKRKQLRVKSGLKAGCSQSVITGGTDYLTGGTGTDDIYGDVTGIAQYQKEVQHEKEQEEGEADYQARAVEGADWCQGGEL